MNKEFVPYELAVKLKQLGFDEPCFGFYYDDGELQIKEGNHYPLGYLNAPLYQQAFRWFREEHGHNGVVEGCKKHGFEWCIYTDMEHYIKPPNNFNIYEEAELACIDKLIDVLETKQQEQ